MSTDREKIIMKTVVGKYPSFPKLCFQSGKPVPDVARASSAEPFRHRRGSLRVAVGPRLQARLCRAQAAAKEISG